MLRSHPRAESINPQSKKCKPSNQRATPPLLQHAKERTFHTRTELFDSFLNYFMEPGITYCSAILEDSAFGALHNAFNYKWTGSCAANPEYDPEDITRKASIHAIVSFTDTTTPFLAILVLSVW